MKSGLGFWASEQLDVSHLCSMIQNNYVSNEISSEHEKGGAYIFILREYKSPFLSTIEILLQIGITHISESAFSKLYIEIRNLSGHI